MELLERLESFTEIEYPNSIEVLRGIDSRLLIEDYCYIYNYLKEPLYRKNIYLSNPYLTTIINEYENAQMDMLGWTLNTFRLSEYESFASRILGKDDAKMLASIDYLILNDNYTSEMFVDILNLNTLESTETMTVNETELNEYMIEKLLVLDDFLENNIVPERCNKKKCEECEFVSSCIKSTRNIPF